MSQRKMTPRGQMSRGANSGPAIMLMPNHIRTIFVPNPPLKPIPPAKQKRRTQWTGMAQYLSMFEKEAPPPRKENPTPRQLKKEKHEQQRQEHEERLVPMIESYRKEQRNCGGEYSGMNCYNTLFIGRLAYEVTERKLLREMETFGPIKDIQIVKDRKTGKSRGYAFVEYENEEDMKRAYRAADGMKIEGREIVADVERGHTVPTWLPRRLGGGLGGTRLGGKDRNVTYPGRFDPSRPMPPGGPPGMGMGLGMGRGGPPGGPGYYDNYGPGPGPGGPPGGPPGGGYGMGRGGGDRYGGGPPPPPGAGRDWDRDRDRGRGGDRYGGGSGGDRSRKRYRSRSRSPERRHSSHSRRRY